MKIAFACLITLAACGGSSIDEPTRTDDGSRTVASPSTSSSTGSTSTSTAPPPPTAPPPATSTATPSAGGAVCSPDAACAGLLTCEDTCYGPSCCRLDCSCSASDPHRTDAYLRCNLYNCTH